MKCQRCGRNNAEVHIRQIVNGKTNEYHLCRECARELSERGTIPPISFEVPFNDFIKNLIPGLRISIEGPETDAKKNLKCPSCGMGYDSFMKSGRMGCPECYVAFREVLKPLLKRIHGSSMHRGSVPVPEDVESGQTEFSKLKKDLEEAVNKEDYEYAAVLRDRLKLMEGKTDEQK